VDVGPDYFNVIGTPLLSGRGIARTDSGSSPLVCVINESLATLYFGSSSPLGRRILMGPASYEIVGVVRDARDTSAYPKSFADNLRDAVPATFYYPVAQGGEQPSFSVTYQLVAESDPAVLIQPAREVIRGFNQALVIGTGETIDEQVRSSLTQERTIARLASVIGAAALLLACVGLYGLLLHIVARRTNEIGIRMALGARRRAIAGMVFWDVGLLLVAGLAIGLPASLASAGFVRSELYGLGPTDPWTLIVVSVILGSVALVAGLVPARRAASVDPLKAIRVE
jgi:ABC-type antimicrobial peptide transport system permease subunit